MSWSCLCDLINLVSEKKERGPRKYKAKGNSYVTVFFAFARYYDGWGASILAPQPSYVRTMYVHVRTCTYMYVRTCQRTKHGLPIALYEFFVCSECGKAEEDLMVLPCLTLHLWDFWWDESLVPCVVIIDIHTHWTANCKSRAVDSHMIASVHES